jgi:hypothetical protein
LFVTFDRSSIVPFSFPFLEKKIEEDITALKFYCESQDWNITPKDLKTWVKKFGLDTVTKTLQILPDSARNHGAWMNTALENRYVDKITWIEINKNYTIQIKKEQNLNFIKINKKYCVNKETDEEIRFDINPQTFIEKLKNMLNLENYVG